MTHNSSQQGNANAKTLLLINKDWRFKVIKLTVNQNSGRQRQDKHLYKSQVTPPLLIMILPYLVSVKRQDIVYSDAYWQLLSYYKPHKTQINIA